VQIVTFQQTQIQARYNAHRTTRNTQQRAKLLAPDFPGVTVDEILAKLEDPAKYSDFKDWRHCLVFWARPPQPIRSLIAEILQRLTEVVPSSSAALGVPALTIRMLMVCQTCGPCRHPIFT